MSMSSQESQENLSPDPSHSFSLRLRYSDEEDDEEYSAEDIPQLHDHSPRNTSLVASQMDISTPSISPSSHEGKHSPADIHLSSMSDPPTPPSPPVSPQESPPSFPCLSPRLSRTRQNFACQKGKSQLAHQESLNLNKELTDVLEVLEKKSFNGGDRWRSYAYRKAITSLKRYPRKISSAEEAKAIRGIGSRIADKIGEILATGTLRQKDFLLAEPSQVAINLFSKVWGAGLRCQSD